jgi:hypothetical protein
MLSRPPRAVRRSSGRIRSRVIAPPWASWWRFWRFARRFDQRRPFPYQSITRPMPAELRHKPRMIRQLDPPAVQCRQQIAIQIRLRLVGGPIFDAMNGKALARPQTAITVTAHRADAVGLQQRRKFIDHVVCAERRPPRSRTTISPLNVTRFLRYA